MPGYQIDYQRQDQLPCSYNPPSRPSLLFFCGAQFYFKSVLVNEPVYYCRDPSCRAKIIFKVQDDQLCDARTLTLHRNECREIKGTYGERSNQKRIQNKFNNKVREIFQSCKGTTNTGSQMWQEITKSARELAVKNLCHIYPPHRKQFIRAIREVRKQAADFKNVPNSELKSTKVFRNLLLKVQVPDLTFMMFAAKETFQMLKGTTSYVID